VPLDALLCRGAIAHVLTLGSMRILHSSFAQTVHGRGLQNRTDYRGACFWRFLAALNCAKHSILKKHRHFILEKSTGSRHNTQPP